MKLTVVLRSSFRWHRTLSRRPKGRKMNKQTSSKSSFPIADLPEHEINDILRRADDHLEQHPLLQVRSLSSASIADLSWRLQNLYFMQAPLFVVKGNGFREQIRRILNLPIRAFGYKQIRFNDELLELVGLMLVQLQEIRLQAESSIQINQADEQRQDTLPLSNQPHDSGGDI
jgi:hypothetical protein